MSLKQSLHDLLYRIPYMAPEIRVEAWHYLVGILRSDLGKIREPWVNTVTLIVNDLDDEEPVNA